MALLCSVFSNRIFRYNLPDFFWLYRLPGSVQTICHSAKNRQNFGVTPNLGLEIKVSYLNKLSMKTLNLVEYLLYSLHNRKTFI